MSRHLMAKMAAGHRHASGWADWHPTDDGHAYLDHVRQNTDSRYTDVDFYNSPLENGHELHVWRYHNLPNMGWSWAINDTGVDPDSRAEGPGRQSWLASGGKDGDSNRYHSTREEAQNEAQQHYEKLFPIGTSTGGHDSGVDYDSLINPRQPLDDDFGDIFGGG